MCEILVVCCVSLVAIREKCVTNDHHLRCGVDVRGVWWDEESGIDMAGVNDSHLAAAADAYNQLLHKLAAAEQFEALASLTQPERAGAS